MSIILRTYVKNKLKTSRKVRWLGRSGTWLDGGQDIIVEDAYPTACANIGLRQQMEAEVEAGVVEVRLITNLATAQPNKKNTDVPDSVPRTVKEPDLIGKEDQELAQEEAIRVKKELFVKQETTEKSLAPAERTLPHHEHTRPEDIKPVVAMADVYSNAKDPGKSADFAGPMAAAIKAADEAPAPAPKKTTRKRRAPAKNKTKA